MDKLQKTAAWLWLYKERIIFVVMVLVLGQRLWLVFNPDTNNIEEPLRTLVEPSGAGPLPPVPPAAPIIYVSIPYPELTRNNLFWVHAGSPAASSGGGEANISLISVMSGTTPRVRLQGSSGRKLYKVGGVVDGWTVEEIDTDAKTVIIVNEATGERLTLGLS